MNSKIETAELVRNLAKNAWESYRRNLQNDGFEPQLLDALEEKMCVYIFLTWFGALAELQRNGRNFDPAETICGYDGNYIKNRSDIEVRSEILARGRDALAAKDGRMLGGKVRAGRIRNVCENWSYNVSNLLEAQGRGSHHTRLIRLIASEFQRHSQKMLIEDQGLLEKAGF